MKVLFVLVSLCALVVLIRGEPCQGSDQCQHTSCDSSSKPACINHICTCVTSTGCGTIACSHRDQCDGCQCEHHGHGPHHCYDGHCVCERFHGFPGK